MFCQILVPSTGDASDAIVFETARAATLDTAAHLHVLFAKRDPANAALSMAGGGLDGGYGLATLIEMISEEGAIAEAAARVAWAAFAASLQLGSGGVSTTLEVALDTDGTLMLQQGRTSDLLVIGRAFGGQQVDLARLHGVLSGLGRPMLIAAPVCPGSLVHTVVIAWKDTEEAARAVSAAMPFIALAERVLVMTAGEEGSERDTAQPDVQASAERLVATLQRHAPLVRAHHVPLGAGSAAQALLAAAVEAGASLLVMGGYGHGELRERIFGGFTKTVLGAADMPVLMMH